MPIKIVEIKPGQKFLARHGVPAFGMLIFRDILAFPQAMPQARNPRT
jgi:hypothetical protein